MFYPGESITFEGQVPIWRLSGRASTSAFAAVATKNARHKIQSKEQWHEESWKQHRKEEGSWSWKDGEGCCWKEH